MYDIHIVRENPDNFQISASFASQTLNNQTTYKNSGAIASCGHLMAREGKTMCMPSCMSC